MSFASVFGSPILWALNPSTASSFKLINGGIKIAVPAGTGFGYGGLSIECSLRPQTKATAHSHENKAKRESAIGHKAHLQVDKVIALRRECFFNIGNTSLDDVERVNNALLAIRLIKIWLRKNYNVSWKEIKSGTKAF
ncbi:hypothetical protein NC651_013625 [Populus alba x Populus x berolinensis]|nr:hypothetical protein NC651_013625 [Populus alba x Populus x berolinensis]